MKLYQKAELESVGKTGKYNLRMKTFYTPRALCGSNGAVYERVTLPARFDTFRYLSSIGKSSYYGSRIRISSRECVFNADSADPGLSDTGSYDRRPE